MTDKEFIKEIGSRIAKFRKEKKMTQMEVSDQCDMEQSAYARIESGRVNLTALSLRKISKALGVPVKKIFDFE